MISALDFPYYSLFIYCSALLYSLCLFWLIKLSFPPLFGFSKTAFGAWWDYLFIYLFSSFFRFLMMLVSLAPLIFLFAVPLKFQLVPAESAAFLFAFFVLTTLWATRQLSTLNDLSLEVENLSPEEHKIVVKKIGPLPHDVSILKSAQITASEGAVTYGGGSTMNRIVFPKDGLEEILEYRITAIYAHELIHVKRQDSVFSALVIGQSQVLDRMMSFVDKVSFPILGLILNPFKSILKVILRYYQSLLVRLRKTNIYFSEYLADLGAAELTDSSEVAYVLLCLIRPHCDKDIQSNKWTTEKRRQFLNDYLKESFSSIAQKKWLDFSLDDFSKFIKEGGHPLLQSRIALLQRLYVAQTRNDLHFWQTNRAVPLSTVVILTGLVLVGLFIFGMEIQNSITFHKEYLSMLEQYK